MFGEFFILNEIEFWKIALVFLGCVFASFIGTSVGSDGFIYMISTGFLNLPNAKIFGCYKWFATVNSVYSILKYRKNKSMTAYKFFKFCFPYGIILWIPAAYIGSLLSVKYSGYIVTLLPIITISLALYKTFVKTIKNQQRKMSPNFFFYGIITLMFFYIGFFGPGSGTFLILLSSYFLGSSLKSGSILSRHVDLFANIISVLIFTFSKDIYIDFIILTSIAGIIGSKISMYTMSKHGTKFLEKMLVVILYFISMFYLWEIFSKDKKKCYFLEKNSEKYEWIESNINTIDECFEMDSCKDGHGKSNGKCFKWAKSKDDQGDPW